MPLTIRPIGRIGNYAPDRTLTKLRRKPCRIRLFLACILAGMSQCCRFRFSVEQGAAETRQPPCPPPKPVAVVKMIVGVFYGLHPLTRKVIQGTRSEKGL